MLRGTFVKHQRQARGYDILYLRWHACRVCLSFFRLGEQKLESMLQERQTQEERDMVKQRERGYGPTSALASHRLFDAPEGTGTVGTVRTS